MNEPTDNTELLTTNPLAPNPDSPNTTIPESVTTQEIAPLPQDQTPNNIILIGLMGAGKSTIGKELAQRLGLGFIDLDQLVEEIHKKSIASIFSEEGEPTFRQFEIEMLDSIKNKTNFVIATGGGTPLTERNWQTLSEMGTIIYLQASGKEILKRLNAWEQSVRPLIQADLTIETLDTLLSERAKWYERADLEISTDGASTENIVTKIVFSLRNKDKKTTDA